MRAFVTERAAEYGGRRVVNLKGAGIGAGYFAPFQYIRRGRSS